jgi:anthranilate phosphoribosyltransferase
VSEPRAPILDAIAKLAGGDSLSREEARAALGVILAGEAAPSQVAAFLMGLRSKGETEEEVVGLAECMRAVSLRVHPSRPLVIDLCGTGGDGTGTFNISTAASFVVVGAGAAVAKHGNRAASSRSGSADVLEALAVPVDLPPSRAEAAIDEIGFAFLFAQLYHPAMKHVAPVRKELRIRTVFNLIGPLASPAGVARQLVGVCEARFRPLLAGALVRLGSEEAWVAHGHGGIDEVSLEGPTSITVAGAGGTREISVTPGEGGVRPAPLEALRGGDAARNAVIIEEVLEGRKGPPRDAVLLNAGAALAAAGVASGFAEGVERAAEAIDSGAARAVLLAARRFR